MTGLSWGCFAGYFDRFWLKNCANVFSMYWIGFDHGTVVWSSMVQCLGLTNPALIFGTFAPRTSLVAFSFSMIECAMNAVNGPGTRGGLSVARSAAEDELLCDASWQRRSDRK